MKMDERVRLLLERRAKFREMGGKEKVDKQHERGKLDARQRIAKLLDPDTFLEMGLLATDRGQLPEEWPRPSPADAVICGTGKINGRMVCIAAYDFTIYNGSIG